MKKITLFLMVCSLAACATTTPSQKTSRMAFPVLEYQGLADSGASTVKGQVLLKVKGGEVKMVTENEVFLNPVTSYSDDWYEKAYIQGRLLDDPDPRLLDHVIRTVTDESGKFIFKDVPPGQYYVSTVVKWPPPAGYRSDLQALGGVASKKITVEEDYDVTVELTCILQYFPVADIPIVF